MEPLTATEIAGLALVGILGVVAAVTVDRKYGHAAGGGGALGLVAAVGVLVYLRAVDKAAAVALAVALGQQALQRFKATPAEPDPDPEPNESSRIPEDDDAPVVDRRPSPTQQLDRSAYPHAPTDQDADHDQEPDA